MNRTGRLTLPVEIRTQLGVEGEIDFEVEVDPDQDAVILRPAVVLRRGDAWAYTPKHRKLMAAARSDARGGRVLKLTEGDLAEMGDRGR
ncbi:MAG: AbrB/MazE/SpoVT family DNA-binding domain-containing protein [Actinomycetota bacterium]